MLMFLHTLHNLHNIFEQLCCNVRVFQIMENVVKPTGELQEIKLSAKPTLMRLGWRSLDAAMPLLSGL